SVTSFGESRGTWSDHPSWLQEPCPAEAGLTPGPARGPRSPVVSPALVAARLTTRTVPAGQGLWTERHAFVTSFGEGTRPAATRPTKPSAAGSRRSVGRRGRRAAGSAEVVRPVVVARPPELAVRRVAAAVARAAVADRLPPEGVAARRLPRDRELHEVARAA